MGKKIEGYWDCSQCGTTKIKGRFRNCINCGKPRGKDIRFYMIETTYAENQDDISEEPDWYCSYCESLNSSKVSNCESCGSSREESDKNYFDLLEKQKEEKIEKENKEKLRQQQINDYKEFRNNQKSSNDIYKNFGYYEHDELYKHKKDFKKTFNFKPLLICFSLFLLIFSFIFLIIPKETTLFVNEKRWERAIEIEEYKTVREDNWSIPDGGRLVYETSEVHHYDQIISHYETVTEQKSETYISGYSTETDYIDLGNGYFDTVTKSVPIYDTRYWTETRQEPVYMSVPVYQTKYYYDIERWITKDWIKSSGINDEPYWPNITLKNDLEREGSKNQKYSILTTNKKGKEKECDLNFDDWNNISINSNIKVKISMGQISEIIKDQKSK